jgi:hypothetical protein
MARSNEPCLARQVGAAAGVRRCALLRPEAVQDVAPGRPPSGIIPERWPSRPRRPLSGVLARLEPYFRSPLMHPEWLIGLVVLLVAVLPWIAAIVWIASRAGWSSVFSKEGAFPSQASQIRGFGGGPSK